MNNLTQLFALSPIDGRYNKHTKDLSNYFSEAALIKYRVKVECLYLLALIDFLDIKVDTDKKLDINNIWSNITDDDLIRIKDIESKTNHDVKSIEYFIKDALRSLKLDNIIEMVHFGLTSEDINNLSYSLMLKDSLLEIIFPSIKNILIKLIEVSEKFAYIPMLARTHGQAASPTTLGKEMAVFLNRLIDQVDSLLNIKLKGKLNGATGNYNAFYVAFPEKDWFEFSNKFVTNLDLEQNILTTQIEPHDRFADIFDLLSRINNILLDMNIDVWQYISLGYFVLEKKADEIGSSTMPHKINPIDFENSEGNLSLANSLLHFMKDKLTKSRLQRDLSDSTVLRNIGSVLGYCLIGYKSIIKGLNKISPNTDKMLDDLNNNIEVLSEGIQTILRAEGFNNSYELLKDLTRGNKIYKEDLELWIGNLDIDNSIKIRLLELSTDKYTGIASELAIKACQKAKSIIKL